MAARIEQAVVSGVSSLDGGHGGDTTIAAEAPCVG